MSDLLTSNKVSPLLRLDDYCIRLILAFLRGNDVLYLMRCASPMLRARIAQNTQHFEALFKSSGFVDCNAHLQTLAPLQSLTSLSLATKYGRQRVYAPIDWDILPPKLTDLSLKFAGCVDSFMSTPQLSSLFQGLKQLSLFDTSSEDIEEPHQPLNFSALPRHLQTLCIETSRYTPFIQTSLEGLPPHLETLALRTERAMRTSFDLRSLRTPRLPPITPVALATLPQSLRTLELIASSTLIWTIRMSQLPTSLEIFKLHGDIKHAEALVPPQGRSLLITKDMGCLTSLRVFSCKDAIIPVSALSDLPASLTSIDMQLNRSRGVDQLAEHADTLQKLSSSNYPGLALPAHLALSLCQNLRSFSIYDFSTYRTPWPTTLTKLHAPAIYAPLPPLLKDLGWHSPTTEDAELVSELPPSLERLSLHNNGEIWNRVCARCEDGTLPNLRQLSSAVNFELTCLPKQLHCLSLAFDNGAQITSSFYESLRCSDVRTLEIVAYGNIEGVEELSTTLLGGTLPEKLESLCLEVYTTPPPSAQWPRTLTHLRYTTNGLEEAILRDGSALFRSLPKGMISLQLEGIGLPDMKCRIPLQDLPPTLSHFETIDPQDRDTMVIRVFPRICRSMAAFQYDNPNFTNASFCAPLVGTMGANRPKYDDDGKNSENLED